MGRMKEIFMEVYQKYDGNIPYDMTVKDFVAQAEQYKKELELEQLRHEQETRRSISKEIYPGDEKGSDPLKASE